MKINLFYLSVDGLRRPRTGQTDDPDGGTDGDCDGRSPQVGDPVKRRQTSVDAERDERQHGRVLVRLAHGVHRLTDDHAQLPVAVKRSVAENRKRQYEKEIGRCEIEDVEVTDRRGRRR